jgi:Flp pilus assembly pilin Flp
MRTDEALCQPANRRRAWRSESGATATEYATLLGLIGLIVLTGAAALGLWVKSRLSGNDSGTTPPAETSPGAPPPAEPTDPGQSGKTLTDSFDGQGNLTWKFSNGTWKTSGGQLVSNNLSAMAIADVPYSNYTYSLTMQTKAVVGPNSPGGTRAVFGYQDKKNYWAVVPSANGRLELAQMANGQWRPWVAYADVGLDRTAPHQYQITATGGRIQVAVDGVQYIDYQSSSPTLGGGVGVANSKSRGAIDNVRVSPK